VFSGEGHESEKNTRGGRKDGKKEGIKERKGSRN
jgi:hypothetical protein